MDVKLDNKRLRETVRIFSIQSFSHWLFIKKSYFPPLSPLPVVVEKKFFVFLLLFLEMMKKVIERGGRGERGREVVCAQCAQAAYMPSIMN